MVGTQFGAKPAAAMGCHMLPQHYTVSGHDNRDMALHWTNLFALLTKKWRLRNWAFE
jgi:hypothetical protein